MPEDDPIAASPEYQKAIADFSDYFGEEGAEALDSVGRKLIESVRATPERTAEPPAAPPEPPAAPSPDDDVGTPFVSWEESQQVITGKRNEESVAAEQLRQDMILNYLQDGQREKAARLGGKSVLKPNKESGP